MNQGLLPSDWQTITLGELCGNNFGVIQTGPFGSQLHASDYQETGIGVVNPTHLRFNSIEKDSLPFISTEKANSLSKHFLKEGDILISRRGDFSRYSHITGEYVGWLCGTGCLLIRLRNPNVDNLYLSFFIGASQSQQYLLSNSVGSIMPNLNTKILQSLPVVLPTLSEQRAIAKILLSINEAKGARQRELLIERERKAALMRYLFTHGTRGEARKQTEIGEIPESWSVVKLGNHCFKPDYGYTASATTNDTGIKFLRITDLQDDSVDWQTVPFCECDEEAKRKYLLQSGDLVIARIGATTGKAFLLSDCQDTVFASYLIRVRTKPDLNPSFLNYFTQTALYWQHIDQNKGGRLKGGVNIPILQNLTLPLPSESEQDEIACSLRFCDTKINALERESILLEELFKAMLEELMTGHLSAVPLIESEQLETSTAHT